MMKEWSKIINCPQCATELPIAFQYAKLTVCTHCDSTIFLEDDAVRLAGEQSVLSEEPSLLELGTPFVYRKTQFTPVGKIRYAHDVGYWEEWWVMDNGGRGFWISVDEGDFAFEKPFKVNTHEIPKLDSLSLGQQLPLFKEDWQVTEIGEGKCEGFKGDLPQIVQIDEVIPYVHLSGLTGQLITLEYFDDQVFVYKGEWVDPFEIKAAI